MPESDWRCSCGAPLEFTEPLGPAADAEAPAPEGFHRDRGVWSLDGYLPDVARANRVSLGEGWTPLIDQPALAPAASLAATSTAGTTAAPTTGATAGLAGGDLTVSVKLEYVSPTGSFKDRGAAVTVALAAELGVDRVLEDSSGNAGRAIATYAARAGLEARIYVPVDAATSKVAAIERTGADVRHVDGDRQAVTDACVEAVEDGEGWYASHAWHPAFYAGTATFAFEVAAQAGWSVPDAIVTPVGHGTLLLGAFRGFRALREAGWTERVPRLLGVQAAGVAPLVAARHGHAAAEADSGQPNDVADGIQVTVPAREGQIHEALDATDGDVIAAGADETTEARDDLARAGFHVEPTSAVALAGLGEYVDRGVLASDADVVVPLTGTGLKG
ncbi:MAG: pyridoxal-phosphate dependent enzyme [Haloarculaceae archaeon]